MKKVLSIALSFVMLVSCFAVSSMTVLAAPDTKTAVEYKMGDTFAISYNSVTENDYVIYAKYVATENAVIEFNIDKGVSKGSKAELNAVIYNTKLDEEMWNFSDAENLDAPSVACAMKKGQTYYFAFSAENAGTFTANVKIQKHVHKYDVAEVPAMYYKFDDELVQMDGQKFSYCAICDDVKATVSNYAPKSLTLSKTSYVYDGNAKKPAVTVKDRKGNKIAASNYKVTYSKNKAVGTATVKITFNGKKYEGEMTKTFKIVPKGTTLSKVTAKKKGFAVSWKKQATQTTGYQIQYSTDKNFKKNNKTVTVKGAKNTSQTVSKLSAKKKYYVRVRTYKTVSGKNYYSAWSKSKPVTTKK